MKKLTAKLGINDISPVVLSLVLAAMIAAAGLLALAGFQGSASMLPMTAGCNASSIVACGAAYNATSDAVSGIGEVTSQFPTIGVIVGVVIIIGIVVAGFAMRRN